MTTARLTDPGDAGRGIPVPGRRPGPAVHRVVRCGPGRRRHRNGADPAATSPRECWSGKVRPHRPDRGHRPDADSRRTTPPVSPGRLCPAL